MLPFPLQSYLVTLIPVLVSMTSKDEMPQEPRFENETDKPAWWPKDVQWRNPKCYMQDHLEKVRISVIDGFMDFKFIVIGIVRSRSMLVSHNLVCIPCHFEASCWMMLI